MKIEKKRIFISDLPEETNQSEIETLFKAYGEVTSVDIKHRKELGPQNKSLSFAYVNIEADDRSLQRCFKDFAENDWHGEYVELQLAKESFLDRLKRERDESVKSNILKGHLEQKTSNDGSENHCKSEDIPICTTVERSKRSERITLDTNPSEVVVDSYDYQRKKRRKEPSVNPNYEQIIEVVNGSDDLPNDNSFTQNEFAEDIVVKNNKYKLHKGQLKIEKTGNDPIAVIDLKKTTLKKPAANSVPDIKRIQSVRDKVKEYSEKKSFIKQALLNVDTKPKNRIVFDEEEDILSSKPNRELTSGDSRKSLFDGSDEEDDFQPDFEFKAQYEGTKGKKLLSMRAKFNNDKRFEMNERFWEDDEDKTSKIKQPYLNKNYDAQGGEKSKDVYEESVEEEKEKDLAILSQVLGHNIVSKLPCQQKNSITKKMVRYDPTDEKCASLELTREEPVPKKRKRKDAELSAEKKQEEKEQPVVSKEVFYKVTGDLKEVMQEPKTGFSLLGMFGRNEEDEDKCEPEQEIAQELPKIKNKLFTDKNPFKYDSSDDENETEIVNEEQSKQRSYENKEIKRDNMTNRLVLDSFFFKGDDWRFDDGLDFIKRIAVKGNEDFIKVRQELKSIVRSKVRNNQKKNRPFKKKLGGNAKKKRLRIKKALKR